MRPFARRALVVIASCVAFCALVAGCSTTDSQPELTDTRGSTDTAEALETLVEADAIDPLPTPFTPELLGVGKAQAAAAPPDTLAFEAEAIATDGRPDGVAADDGTVDPTPTPAPDEVATQPDAEPADGDDTVEDVLPQGPPPPPAEVGSEPRYEDPSANVVIASGRPFALDAEPPTAAAGVTDDTIAVGGLVTESLAGFFHREQVCDGALARFEQANVHGELTRTIDFQGCYDDVGELDLSAGLTNTLIRSEVFAVVPLASATFLAHETLNDADIPYVGDERLPGFCGRQTPYGFGTRGALGCPVLDARGYVTLVEPVMTVWRQVRPERTEDSIAYGVVADATGEVVAASRSFEADLLGHATPTYVPVLPTAAQGAPPDWSTVSRQLLDVGADVIMLDGPRLDGLPAQLRADGFTGELVIIGTVDPLDIADPDTRLTLAPVTVISPGLDVASRATDGWDAVVGAARRVGLAEDEIGLDFVQGYLAADFLVQAIAATPEPLTGVSLANMINGGWWYPGVDGLSCGSWWPASHFIVTPCVSVSEIDVFDDAAVPVLGLVETAPQFQFNLQSD